MAIVMRFNKVIELVVETTVDDGLGGRTRGERVISKLNARVDQLSLDATYKMYGEAYINNIRAVVLGHIEIDADKIKYENEYYRIVNKSFVRNKTCYILELIQDE